MASSSSNKLTIKLLIDTKRDKVLFAEASQQVVDFLLSFLRLPLATVASLLPKNDIVGSFGNLYESFENLEETYIQSDQCKDIVLKPRLSIASPDILGLIPAGHDSDNKSLDTVFYMCPSHCTYSVACDIKTLCPSCRHSMNFVVPFVGNKVVAQNVFTGRGFVKKVVTYMVLDDLVIQPMSTISSILFLNKFEIEEASILEEKVIELGMTEGLDLLKASLESKTVLTNVFLKNSCQNVKAPLSFDSFLTFAIRLVVLSIILLKK